MKIWIIVFWIQKEKKKGRRRNQRENFGREKEGENRKERGRKVTTFLSEVELDNDMNFSIENPCER